MNKGNVKSEVVFKAVRGKKLSLENSIPFKNRVK